MYSLTSGRELYSFLYSFLYLPEPFCFLKYVLPLFLKDCFNLFAFLIDDFDNSDTVNGVFFNLIVGRHNG